MLMHDRLFFASYLDHEALFIQYWAGSVKINFVNEYTEFLSCKQKIILMSVKESNFRIDLIRQLVKQGNYIVLMDIREVCADVPYTAYESLVHDCPELALNPLIIGGDNAEKFAVSIETFFFNTLSDHNVLRSQTYTIDQIFKTINKPKKFTYLNGADYPHRNQLWRQLDKQGVLEDSICSYLGYHPADNSCDIPLTVLDSKYESPWVDLDSASAFLGDSRNYINFKTNFFEAGWVESHVVPAQYTNSYFSVVTETIVRNHCKFVTEKTYKPLLAGHPFIVLASQGFYSHLHSMGFKTWPDLIDESFDQEPDVNKRINMISQEVTRLCNSDLDAFLQQAQAVCLHNQQHYINYRPILFKSVHYKLKMFFEQVLIKAHSYFIEHTLKELHNV